MNPCRMEVKDNAYRRHSAHDNAPRLWRSATISRMLGIKLVKYRPRALLDSFSWAFCALASFLFTCGMYVREGLEREKGEPVMVRKKGLLRHVALNSDYFPWLMPSLRTSPMGLFLIDGDVVHPPQRQSDAANASRVQYSLFGLEDNPPYHPHHISNLWALI